VNAAVLGLVVTTNGFPLGYEVFDGNRAGVTTLPQVLKEMTRWRRSTARRNASGSCTPRDRERGELGETPRSMLERFEKDLVCEARRDGRAWGQGVRVVGTPPCVVARHGLGRVGLAQRGLLPAEDESHRPPGRRTLAHLHSTHGRRGRLPHREDRAQDPADPAPAREARPSHFRTSGACPRYDAPERVPAPLRS